MTNIKSNINNKFNLSFLALVLVFVSGCARSNAVICKPFPNLNFPGAGAFAGIEISLPPQNFPIDLRNLIPPLNAGERTVSATVDKITLKAKTGITNFDFLTRLVVDASSSTSSSLNSFNVIDYDRHPQESAENYNPFDNSHPGWLTFFAKTNAPTNITPYVDAGLVNLRITVTGVFPSAPWSLDLLVCIGNVSASYVESQTP